MNFKNVLLKMKKINKFDLNCYRCTVQLLVLRILRRSLTNFSRGRFTSPLRGSIAPVYTKNMYDLSVAIINKCFEFQNDRLQIICVRYNCTLHNYTAVLKKL